MCRLLRGQSPMRAVTQSRTTSPLSGGDPPGAMASGRERPSQAPGRWAAGPPPRALGRELASDWRGEGPTPTAQHAIDLTREKEAARRRSVAPPGRRALRLVRGQGERQRLAVVA